LSIATVLTLASVTARATTDNLIYVAVDPCRVVDTRNAGGALTTTSRDFLVSGTSGQLAAQGGTADCLNPRAGVEPLAISAYVLAISPTGGTGGVLTAFPAGDPDPAVGAGSTVNFAAQQAIGNTTNITLCDPTGTCPSDGEFAILPRNSNQVHVVVDVQGYFYSPAGSCPDDMVANGDSCIDKYEASVWSTSTGDAGTQLSPAGPGGGSPNIVCLADGSDCGANATNPIYALSVAGVIPAGHITWYQAAQACANVGKRLPTTAEWQTAALGTPSGDGGGCNITSGGTTPSLSGDNDATCASPAGAFDMIGNVWEMTAELDLPTTAAAGIVLSSDTLIGRSLGDDFSSTGDATTTTMFPVAPNSTNGKVGFRCVR